MYYRTIKQIYTLIFIKLFKMIIPKTGLKIKTILNVYLSFKVSDSGFSNIKSRSFSSRKMKK